MVLGFVFVGNKAKIQVTVFFLDCFHLRNYENVEE